MAGRPYNPPPIFDSELHCEKCNEDQPSLVSLDCRHTFCMICMSYLVLKNRTRRQDEHKVSCISCGKTTKLSEDLLEAIGVTIKETLLPRLNSIEQTCQLSCASVAEEDDEGGRVSEFSLRKQAKQHDGRLPPGQSRDHSIEHITPSTRYLLSKGDSPSSCQPTKERCVDHPFEEYSFVCLTCSTRLLCVKCISQPLHHHHNIKSLEKGMQLLSEQLSYRRIEVNEKIDLLETRKRQLQGKKGLLQDKCNKSKMQVSEEINHLINRLRKKEVDLLQKCHNCYQQLEEELNDQFDALSKKMFDLRKFKYDCKRLQIIEVDGEPEHAAEFFGLYAKLKEELDSALSDSGDRPPVQDTFQTDIQLNEKDLAETVESINRINLVRLAGVLQGACAIATPAVPGSITNARGSLATSKLGNIVTQFTSKNTSAEKRRTKHLKTEDNESLRLQTEQMKSAGKLRTNLNSRFNSPQSRIGNVPSYITKVLEKHTVNARGEQSTEFNYSSKLSIANVDCGSSFVEGDGSRIGGKLTRMERKTTNPLQSLQTQKLIFDNKRNKIK